MAHRMSVVLAAISMSVAISVPGHAADLQMQIVDNDCWVEIFDDTKFDTEDAHVKIMGPAEFATLKDLSGKDWNNDVESLIVGPNSTVSAYKDKDFKGPEVAFTPGQRVPELSKLKMGDEIESMRIKCGK
jgi:hypothetical protein